MIMFFLKIFILIFCVCFNSGTAVGACRPCEAVCGKQSAAQVYERTQRLLDVVKSMEAQGFSQDQILEGLQKINKYSGKKSRRTVYLVLGAVVVGGVAAAAIYFLIREIMKQKAEIGELTSAAVGDKASIAQTSSELATTKSALAAANKACATADERVANLESGMQVYRGFYRGVDAVILVNPDQETSQRMKVVFPNCVVLTDEMIQGISQNPSMQALRGYIVKTDPTRFPRIAPDLPH